MEKRLGLLFGVAALFGIFAGCIVPAETRLSNPVIENRRFEDFGEFGKLELVDRIDCGKPPAREYVEYPGNATRVEPVLGRLCRVMPNTGDTVKYFTYLIGKGKKLQAGHPYLLVIEYPEDASRSFHVSVGGCEGTLGVATGQATGDAVRNHLVDNNIESLKYPLSGEFKRLEIFFVLNDHFPGYMMNDRRFRDPADGFFVTVSQYEPTQDPFSGGAAIGSIALYRFDDLRKTVPSIVYPEGALPRRFLFWREEMSDGAVAEPGNPAEKETYRKATDDPVDWYRHKIAMLRFLGMNTFCRDLLEFGFNQGWDPSKYGGNRWFYTTTFDDRWQKILAMLKEEHPDLYWLPYYEYSGAIGTDSELALGVQRRAVRPDGSNRYTDVSWLRSNIDFADPDSLTDVERLLDCTVAAFPENGNFAGVWFRPRMEANPVSFSDIAIRRYNAEHGTDFKRADFAADKALEARYVVWFRKMRREWLIGVRDWLRKKVNPASAVLYTADYRDPGVNLQNIPGNSGKPIIVTDEVAAWEKLLNSDLYRSCAKRSEYEGISVRSYDDIVRSSAHLAAICAVPREHEDDRPARKDSTSRWDLAHMPADPETYQSDSGILMTYTFNRLYTVSNPALFPAFGNGDGEIAAVRHYGLNEHDMGPGAKSIVGTYFSMVDRGAPYTMLAEARLLAGGDPRYIAYLTPSNMMRSSPREVRAFNRAFLALPAVKSRIIYDNSGVVVREYPTEYGSYFAVINTDTGIREADIPFPCGKLIDRLGTAKLKQETPGIWRVTLEPAEVFVLKGVR